MKEEKSLNQFCRNDGYNPGVDYSDSIQETWIHKPVVKLLGEGDDDFIIEEKPVCIDRIDLNKRIQEEAKTTDLKYLLEQFLRSGDESILNVRPGFGGDITQIQNVLDGSGTMLTPEQIKASLPSEFSGLTAAQIASMSDVEIVKYVNQVRAKIEEASNSVNATATEEKEG